MLEDFTRELLWTRTARTPALAVRPTRIILGMAAALIASLIGSIPIGSADQPTIAATVSGSIAGVFSSATDAILSLNAAAFIAAVTDLVMLPGTLIQERPWATVLLVVPMMVTTALIGGAISRAAAIEFTSARFSDWPADLRVSLRALGSSAGALLAPLVIVGVIVLLIAAGGVLLGVPVLDIVGSVLYVVALALSLLALLVLILHALSLPMLVPAVMVEGTDAFDAVQRCYAYVLGRPLHLLVHATILLVLGTVSIALLALVAGGADQMTQWAASQFAGDAGLEVLTGTGELNATQPAAHAVIAFFRAVLDLVIAGFAISYFFTAGTVLYLVARRVCDGQDVNDLWDPAQAQG